MFIFLLGTLSLCSETVTSAGFYATVINYTGTNATFAYVNITYMNFTHLGIPAGFYINTTNNTLNSLDIVNLPPNQPLQIVVKRKIGQEITHISQPRIMVFPPQPILQMKFLLTPAATLRITVTNGTHNIPNYMLRVLDKKTGNEVFMFMNTSIKNVTVPEGRNYTIEAAIPPFINPPPWYCFGSFPSPHPPCQQIPLPPRHNTTAVGFNTNLFNITLNLSWSPVRIFGKFNVTQFGPTMKQIKVVAYILAAGNMWPQDAPPVDANTTVNTTVTGGNYTLDVIGNTDYIIGFYARNVTSAPPPSDTTLRNHSNYVKYIVIRTGTTNFNLNVNITASDRLAGNNWRRAPRGLLFNGTMVDFQLVNASGAYKNISRAFLLLNISLNRTFSVKTFCNTNDTGGFSIPLRPGNITVQVFAPGYAPRFYKFTIAQTQSSKNITVKKFDASPPGPEEAFAIAMKQKTFVEVWNPNATVARAPLFQEPLAFFNPEWLGLRGRFNIRMIYLTAPPTPTPPYPDILKVVEYIKADIMSSGVPDAEFDADVFQDNSTSTRFDKKFRFGSGAPKIYERVAVITRYDPSQLDESKNVTVKIPKLYNGTWHEIWNISMGVSARPPEYSDYSTAWFIGGKNATPITWSLKDGPLTNLTQGVYIHKEYNIIVMVVPHFSGIAPQIIGTAISPTSTSLGGIQYVPPAPTPSPPSPKRIGEFALFNFSIIVGATEDQNIAGRVIPTMATLFSSKKVTGLRVVLGGPIANPLVVNKSKEIGVNFTKDTLTYKGDVYISRWQQEDYVIISLVEPDQLYVMGTHRYGTEAGLLFLKNYRPPIKTLVLRWFDINGDKKVQLDEIFTVKTYA
ncbi:MAG: carboxypeptidase-like regulatory domain-containing protein [Euryarchaeota archaeon]|nr:carboxypeptidase-like regulatory domain-containing protein [Euryarchaeota archaeon]